MVAISRDTLIRLQKSHIKPSAEMLARAFYDYPLSVYFFPDASDRKRKLLRFFEYRIDDSISRGEAYATSSNLEGVAAWLPCYRVDDSMRERMHLLSSLPILLEMGRSSIIRMWRFHKRINTIQPCYHRVPYWRLQLIGVEPSLQGKGYASMLLRAMLVRLDHEKLPCYLDTQTKETATIYKHYGFEVVGEFNVPSAELNTWVMLREPCYIDRLYVVSEKRTV